jgi:chemotaxis signal transduction protein
MAQPAVGDWNIALPHLSKSIKGSALPVVVGDATFAIPLEQVRYVDYPTKKLTPLPLATSPVEGLASFNNRPLVQINVAQALNIKPKTDNGRIVVVGFAQGDVALLVDEVLGFVSTQPAAHEFEDKEVTLDSSPAQGLPLLKLDEVLPWLKTCNINATNVLEPVTQQIPARSNYSGHVLLVATGKKVIALLANGVDRIEEVSANLELRTIGTEADGLIRIEDYLFPSRSLAKILKIESGVENYALILHDSQQPWALLVERVLRLEKIDRLLSVVPPIGSPSVWYLNDEGEAIEAIDIKEFFGLCDRSDQPKIMSQQSKRSTLPKISTNLSIEGVRINCGKTVCILPLTLVSRTIGDLGEIIKSQAEQNSDSLIPIVDGTMFVEQHPKKGEGCSILLSLCGGKQVVLVVDSASLQSTLSLGQWLPLAALPPPTAFLFDAAIYDETEGCWILRVKSDLSDFLDVWASKRALVNSVLGWTEAERLNENTVH